MRILQKVQGNKFWLTLPGSWLVVFIALGICMPFGVFFILPFDSWLRTGRWEWLSHESLILAVKLSVMAVFVIGTILWIGAKFTNKKGSEK